MNLIITDTVVFYSMCCGSLNSSYSLSRTCHSQQGFSLLELTAVITIMAILSLAALPGMQHVFIRLHRVEGQLALLDLAVRMEQYYLLHGSYQQASIASGQANDLLTTAQTAGGWYLLSISKATLHEYVLQARARFTDQDCPILTYDQQGSKSAIPAIQSQACWA